MHMVESANNSVFADPKGYNYTLNLDSEVIKPSFYRGELACLAQATECDSVLININTNGGNGATATAFVNKILTCKSPVHGHIDDSAASAGSLVFLSCDTHSWGVGCSVMIHSGEIGLGGTPTNAIKSLQSHKITLRELFDTTYKGFVTSEELDKIVDDDWQLDTMGIDLQNRLERMYSYREEVKEGRFQEMDEAMWEQNDIMTEEALNKLTKISDKDKKTFNKVKKALDEAMMEEGLSNENNSV